MFIMDVLADWPGRIRRALERQDMQILVSYGA
jgi:hypothetical protein